MGIELQAVIGAIVGAIIMRFFPGLIPKQPAQPVIPPAAPAPVNGSPKSELEILFERFLLEVMQKKLLNVPTSPQSSQTGPV